MELEPGSEWDDLLEEMASPVLLQLSNTLQQSGTSGTHFFYKVAPATQAVLCGACWAILSFLLLVACCGLPAQVLRERKVLAGHGMERPMLYALLLTMFLDHYSTDNYQTSMPMMSEEFNVSQVEMGLSVLVHLLSFAIFILILGPLSDRVGRRPVILASQVFLVISTLACGCADSFFWFMAGRACQGAASSVYCVVLAAVRDCYPDEVQRTTVTGLVFATATMGPLVAPVMGGLTASILGWRYAFCNVAFGAFMLNIFSFFVVKETAAPYEDTRDKYLVSVARVVGCKRRLLIIVCLGGFKSFFDIIAASSGFILVWQYHFSNAGASILSSLIALAGILGIMLQSSGWVPKVRISSYTPLILPAAIAMLLAGLMFEDSFVGYIGSICFAQVMLYPPIMGMMTDFLEELQDIAGLAASLQTSGAQLISTLVALPGVVAATGGECPMLKALAMCLILTQALLWIGLVPLGLWTSEAKLAS